MTDHSRQPASTDRMAARLRAENMRVGALKAEEERLRNQKVLSQEETIAWGVAREVLMGLGVQLPPAWL